MTKGRTRAAVVNHPELRSPPPRLKKKRFDHTEKAKKRRDRKKKQTKASVKRKLLKDFRNAQHHLNIYNRVTAREALSFHLEKALEALDSCLETRPGNHMLRAQRSICRDELWEIRRLEKVDTKRTIEIIIDPDWHG